MADNSNDPLFRVKEKAAYNYKKRLADQQSANEFEQQLQAKASGGSTYTPSKKK